MAKRSLLALVVLSLPSLCFAQTFAVRPRPFEATGLGAFLKGDYATCAKVMSSATFTYLQEPSPPFVAARCYARLGDTVRAERFLRIALDRGYRNCSNIAGEAQLAKLTDARTRCENNADSFVARSNAELLAAYLADRSDRAAYVAGESDNVDSAETIKRRDAARRVVVHASLRQGSVRTADDYYHAAVVMQHGVGSDDFRMARDLARTAVKLRPWFAEARLLYAQSTDRYLQSVGKPQIFGTQYHEENGVWTLEPFDRTAITDEERARWRVQSVAERLHFIETLNATTK